MTLYSLEWEANVHIQTDGWKAGWRDYRVLSGRPNALESAVAGVSVNRLLIGALAIIRGKSTLQKADRGWRVLDSEVTACKLVPPPDQPNDGRSSEMKTFFAAFKQAVASKDTNRVAKFVRFPLRSVGDNLNEAQFHRHFPLDENDIAAIAQAAAPTSRENGTYFLQIGQAGIDFERDGDGYWKWTSIYYWGD